MQLYDKDLLSVQEVRELVERAKAAQQELSEKSQQEVDAIVKSIADAGVRNARRLAKLAHEETGFGVEADKVIKNVFASRDVYEDYRRAGKGRGKEDPHHCGSRRRHRGTDSLHEPHLHRSLQIRDRHQGRQCDCIFTPSECAQLHSGDGKGDPSGHRGGGRQ